MQLEKRGAVGKDDDIMILAPLDQALKTSRVYARDIACFTVHVRRSAFASQFREMYIILIQCGRLSRPPRANGTVEI